MHGLRTAFHPQRYLRRVGFLLAAGVTAGSILAPTPAFAADSPGTGPSDTRAQFTSEKLQTCEQAGYSPDDDYLELYGQHTETTTDGLITVTGGTVPTPPPDGHLPSGSDYTGVNVELTPEGDAAGVVVDAVVVKASEGSNVYTAPYVPHDLDPDQWYIGPMIITGATDHVADVSHFLVCYHLDDTPAPDDLTIGALLIAKRVQVPEGGTDAAPPESYEATVDCTVSGTFAVTFGPGGGLGTFDNGNRFITGLVPGETCTVTETDSGGAMVTYTPDQQVTIGGGIATFVTITNDFTDFTPATGTLTIAKQATEGNTDETFTIEYACQGTDAPVIGTSDMAPGDTATIEGIRADAFCAIVEPTAALPDGWERIGYDIQGADQVVYGPNDNPVFSVARGAAVVVTVQNSGPASDHSDTDTGGGPSGSAAALPRTGEDLLWTLTAGLGLLAVGVIGIRLAARTRRTD